MTGMTCGKSIDAVAESIRGPPDGEVLLALQKEASGFFEFSSAMTNDDCYLLSPFIDSLSKASNHCI